MSQATELTIDELARRTGMTVRNIRAHQSRGLLPAPQVRGRTGFYGAEHEARIGLIRELQADGFKLEAISRLLDSAGGSSEEVLRFTRAVKALFEDEQPQIVSAAELAERWDAGDTAPRASKGREAWHPAPVARRQLRGAEPDPRPGERRAGRARNSRRDRTRGRGRDPQARRRGRGGVLGAVREAGLEAVRGSGPSRARPARGPRRARAPAALASDALLAMFQIVMTEAVEERIPREVERIKGRDRSRARR